MGVFRRKHSGNAAQVADSAVYDIDRMVRNIETGRFERSLAALTAVRWDPVTAGWVLARTGGRSKDQRAVREIVNNRAGRRGSRLARWCAAAAAGSIVFSGCSSPAASLESQPETALTAVAAPLHAPVWSYRRHTLVALTDDHRLAEVAHADGAVPAQTRLSAPMGSGRNLQISAKDDRRVLVPLPARGKVAVVDLDSLLPIDEFDAGPAPAYLAHDAGMRVLLALSADGSSVTPVDLYGARKLATAKAAGDPAATLIGANRGREIAYHVYGRSGISHYKGPSSPPEEGGSFAMDVAAAAGDGTQVTRSYVASHNDNVLYAVDSRRSEQGLEVVGRTPLPSPIRYLGTDDTRIYAATDQNLVVLETASFTGYPNGTIPVLRVIDYRAGLPAGPVGSAPLSGMAIGPHRVYLTLAGQAHVVSVAKPHL